MTARAAKIHIQTGEVRGSLFAPYPRALSPAGGFPFSRWSRQAATAATRLRRWRLLGKKTLAPAARARSRAPCEVREESTTMGRPRRVASRRMRAMS